MQRGEDVEIIISYDTSRDRKAAIEQLLTSTLFQDCSAADLKKIRKGVIKAYKRFKNPTRPKYGGLARGFTESELEVFFMHCKNKRAGRMFRLQQYLGLRSGEVVSLRYNPNELQRRYLPVFTQKAEQPDMLFLHDKAYALLLELLREDYDAIQSSGYWFPGKKDGHASQHWLRNQFGTVMQKLNINYTYGMSDDQGVHKKPRKLNRLTDHSFRHYFIKKCWKTCRDPMRVMRLARHRKFKSTQVYLQVMQEELDSTMVRAFSGGAPEVVNDEESVPTALQEVFW